MYIEWKSEKDKREVERMTKHNKVTARHMNAIIAAKNFLDIVPKKNGRAHFLKTDYRGYFAIDLESKTRPARLICQPIGDCQKDKDGFYIKETITQFRIIKIDKDYHKK